LELKSTRGGLKMARAKFLYPESRFPTEQRRYLRGELYYFNQ
jgi:hypothetical protein